MNIFDSMQGTMFNTVLTTMGYPATWLPTEGGDLQTAKVLYKGPTEKEKLAGIEYMPNSITMEYKATDFAALKDAVDRGKKEFVTISDISGSSYEFFVKSVAKIFDGKTMEAYLTLKV